MNIKAEELSTGEINVNLSTSVVVKDWNVAALLIANLKKEIANAEVKSSKS